jgi:hypothetical protein
VVLLLELELADSEDEVLDFEDDSLSVSLARLQPGELAEEDWMELEEH